MNAEVETKTKQVDTRTEPFSGMDKAHFALDNSRLAVLATFRVNAVQELVQIIIQIHPASALDAITTIVGIKSKTIFLKQRSITIAIWELLFWQGSQVDTCGSNKV